VQEWSLANVVVESLQAEPYIGESPTIPLWLPDPRRLRQESAARIW